MIQIAVSMVKSSRSGNVRDRGKFFKKKSGQENKKLKYVLLGILIALPLFLIVVLMLVSADPVGEPIHNPDKRVKPVHAQSGSQEKLSQSVKPSHMYEFMPQNTIQIPNIPVFLLRNKNHGPENSIAKGSLQPYGSGRL